MQFKFTSLIIGLLLMSLMVVVFINAMVNGSQNNPDLEFDQATMERYNKMTELQAQMEDVKSKEENVSARTGGFDILGDLLGRGYFLVRVSKESIDTADELSDQAVKDINLGNNGFIFKATLGIIVMVIIIIGILARILTKSDI